MFTKAHHVRMGLSRVTANGKKLGTVNRLSASCPGLCHEVAGDREDTAWRLYAVEHCCEWHLTVGRQSRHHVITGSVRRRRSDVWRRHCTVSCHVTVTHDVNVSRRRHVRRLRSLPLITVMSSTNITHGLVQLAAGLVNQRSYSTLGPLSA